MIYYLQASHQLYIKFHDAITLFDFIKNIVDQCIYLKICKNIYIYIFLVQCIDDILFARSDLNFLKKTQLFLSHNFEINNIGEASCTIGI